MDGTKQSGEQSILEGGYLNVAPSGHDVGVMKEYPSANPPEGAGGPDKWNIPLETEPQKGTEEIEALKTENEKLKNKIEEMGFIIEELKERAEIARGVLGKPEWNPNEFYDEGNNPQGANESETPPSRAGKLWDSIIKEGVRFEGENSGKEGAPEGGPEAALSLNEMDQNTGENHEPTFNPEEGNNRDNHAKIGNATLRSAMGPDN